MNRPAVFNAFDEQLIDEPRRLRELDADAGVRVVVLAGRGRTSRPAPTSTGCAARRLQRGREPRRRAPLRRHAAGLAGMGKPTIARVQGAALGGGTGLTAACDMAIAADAQFSTSEVKFGIIPAVISPFVLRAVGPRHALRIFQSAERIDAPAPWRWAWWARWCRQPNSTPPSPVAEQLVSCAPTPRRPPRTSSPPSMAAPSTMR
jgi:methylglutaconyl-CoA hydratase